ncbi:GGDEF domain-containing protein [Paenibacillus sp. sptzw28]|uniref:GGDEF domain-containing protein n=1 Tax=Paenibacillus sp. sptzw28 TaxID=715179 RepID=UPI001C6F5183|nr:GGDEF domain-containing protein [Paenibacillus sp. sptzw28]QYR20570.1 GGDEF domain-containing protein [Paenibacillus sp. sptzw28]
MSVDGGSGMYFAGRITAAAVTIGTITYMAGLGYWMKDTSAMAASYAFAGVYAAAALPIAWLLGRKYDLLKSNSTIDCMTGLYNRGFIEANFPKLVNQAQRKRKKLTVLILDVNDFKEVNDRFGHEQGDQALRLVSETLQICAQRGEISGRWGGDEFIMICPYADDRLLEKLLQQLQEKLLRLSVITGFGLSVSVGSASFPEQGNQLSELAHTADKRMYADKKSRKMKHAEPGMMQAQ